MKLTLKKWLGFGMCLAIIFSIGTCIEARGESLDGNLDLLNSYELYDTGLYNRFVNKVDGYSLTIDKDLVPNMDRSMSGAILENASKRIAIFNQPLGWGISKASYVNYSNGFLNNYSDYHLEYRGTQTIGGKSVHITKWYRNKLNRVVNDKNYYACLDINLRNGEVLTIFLSSVAPITGWKDYDHLLAGLYSVEKTSTPYIRKAKDNLNKKWNEETQGMINKYFSKTSAMSFGIFEPSAPIDFRNLKAHEQKMEYEFPFLLNYTSFENTYKHPNLKLRLDNAYKEGKILELTLQTEPKANGTSNMVYDILNGEYDDFLEDYARTIAEFQHPILFRLGNEMNGDWCPYSGYQTSRDPEVFVEFYKYVYSFFDKAKAENVIWVWNPNGKSFPDFKWNDELMYYPGDKYVDIVGLTAYNTGNYYHGEKWQSFSNLYDGLYYSYVTKYDKPLMITEFASASLGGDKNQWIIDMFQNIKNYERLKVAIWWDGADRDAYGRVARSYFMTETPQIVETFRNHLQDFKHTSNPAYLDQDWKTGILAHSCNKNLEVMLY